MHADFRIGLGSLLAIAFAISSVQAFYVPGEPFKLLQAVPEAFGKERLPGSKPWDLEALT